MRLRPIEEKDDKILASIIRENLKKYHLNIKGTVYFDKNLDFLSKYYTENNTKRAYYVLVDDNDTVFGGVGFSKIDFIPNCAELQKIYLDENVKGLGYGKFLLNFLCEKVKEKGFDKVYIETHTNLDIAIKMYKKFGFYEIERPKQVNHSSMNMFLIKKL